MAIIQLKEFEQIMNDLMVASDRSREIDKMIQQTPVMRSAGDFFSSAALMMANHDTVVSLLETMFNDNENQWISYWMYEQDYGRNWTKGCATEADGSEIDLSTPQKLYMHLVREMGK